VGKVRIPAAALLIVLSCLACGETAPQHGPLLIQGAVNGVYRPGSPGSCGSGYTEVTGPYGADRTRQVADLELDNGSFTFSPAGQQTFTGGGVTFRAGSGWDIDGDGTSPAGARIHLQGHVSC
jgi:hypothetical protein